MVIEFETIQELIVRLKEYHGTTRVVFTYEGMDIVIQEDDISIDDDGTVIIDVERP